MNANLLWILVPALPLLFVPAVIVWGDRAIRLWWLSCLPALVAALTVPTPYIAEALWPGAQWGNPDFMLRSLLAFTASVWMLAGIFAQHSLAQDEKRRRFWVFWLLSFSGNLLLIIAADALSFYVGFSMMSLAAYGLIIHKPGPRPRKAGRLYLQIAITGELLLFTGLIMASHEAGGSMSLDVWQSASMSPVTLFLLFTGLGLKAGFWPLHVWLPQAHPVAPAPASAVLSGAMIKAGIIGFWQLLPATSEWLQEMSGILMGVALISAFYGVAVGLTRHDPKEVLAYSSVSQMGYLLFITALLWHEPAAAPALTVLICLYAIHHGFCKAALFLAAELLKSGQLRSRHSRALLTGLTALPALALAGLPLSSGAVVKTLLKDGMTAASLEPLILVLQGGAVATALLLLRALYLLRELTDEAPQKRIPVLRLGSWLPLAVMPLALPWFWPEMRDAAMNTLPLYMLAELTWPIAAAVMLAGIALSAKFQVPQMITRRPTPFLLLSLRLKRLLQRPPVPEPEPKISEQLWRNRERRWNRFWHGNTVRNSSWLLLSFLLVAAMLFTIATPF